MKTNTFLLVSLIAMLLFLSYYSAMLLFLSYYSSDDFAKLTEPAEVENPIALTYKEKTIPEVITEEKQTQTYEIYEEKFVFKGEWASEIFDLCENKINLRYHKDSDWQAVKKILDDDLTCNIIRGVYMPLALHLYPGHVPCSKVTADGCYIDYNIKVNARRVNKRRFLALFYHEYGHHVYDTYPKNIDKVYWGELHNQIDGGYVNSYARTNVEEDFAETFAQAIFLVYHGEPYWRGQPPKKLTFMKNYLYWLNKVD